MTRKRQVEARRRAEAAQVDGEARNDPPATPGTSEAVEAASASPVDGLEDLERELAALEAALNASSADGVDASTPYHPQRPLVEVMREAAGLLVNY